MALSRRTRFDDDILMPHTEPVVPLEVLKGLQSLKKSKEKRVEKASRSLCDTLMIALRNSWRVVALLCIVLLMIARTASAYQVSLVYANREISRCNKAIKDWSQHQEHYHETQEFIDNCVIKSQFNPYLYAFDLMSERVWLLSFVCARLHNFGISLDGAVAQDFNLIVVFVAISAIVACMVGYIVVEWLRQRKKVTEARNEVC
jgi:hypothetical protein